MILWQRSRSLQPAELYLLTVWEAGSKKSVLAEPCSPREMGLGIFPGSFSPFMVHPSLWRPWLQLHPWSLYLCGLWPPPRCLSLPAIFFRLQSTKAPLMGAEPTHMALSQLHYTCKGPLSK
jgi:hypothetical protein